MITLCAFSTGKTSRLEISGEKICGHPTEEGDDSFSVCQQFSRQCCFSKKTYRYRFKHSSTSTTAGDVYLADSAQVPRVQAKYTADPAQVPRVHVQVHRGESRGALGHGHE